MVSYRALDLRAEKNPADGSSNLPRATYTEPRSSNQQTSAVLAVLIALHNRGYAETTVKGVGKKLRLSARNVNLSKPEEVTEYICSLSNSNTKSLLTSAYRHYARLVEVTWEKPKFAKVENPIKCPLEESLDVIIKEARGLKRKVASGILKDTGLRPIELHGLTLENIDLEQGIIHVKPAERGNPRSLKLRAEIHADLKQLIGRLRPGLKDRIFPSPERLARN